MKKIRINLDKLLEKHNMTQKELSDLTHIRAAAISELVNNQRTSINKDHLNKIINTLGIEDIGELISIVDD